MDESKEEEDELMNQHNIQFDDPLDEDFYDMEDMPFDQERAYNSSDSYYDNTFDNKIDEMDEEDFATVKYAKGYIK